MTPGGPDSLIYQIYIRIPIEQGAPAMRKLLVNTFLTLDGVMQAPGGPGEDDDGGFAQGGWSVNYWDEQMAEVMAKATETPFDLLLGRKTYGLLAKGE